jgi:hypothetical protein
LHEWKGTNTPERRRPTRPSHGIMRAPLPTQVTV